MKELHKRTLSGIAILTVSAAGVLVNGWLYTLLMSAVILLATIEYHRLALGRRYLRERLCIVLAELLFFVGAAASLAGWLPARWLTLSVLPLFVAMAMLLSDGGEGHDFNPHLFFPIVYILLPVSLSLLLGFSYRASGVYTPQLTAPVISIAWIADIGAYFFGMAFGQRPNSRKLAPSLSPNKSWAGVWGALLVSLVASLLAWWVYNLLKIQVMSLPMWLTMAVVIAVAGIFGDLFESLIKRHFSVKDSSHFIPGHGGILDRFDDLFFVFPAVTVWLVLMGIIG